MFWFDGLGIAWMITGMVLGYRQGFSRQVSGLFACILGLYLAASQTEYVVKVLKIPDLVYPGFTGTVVFVAIAFISSLAFSLLGIILARYFVTARMKSIDRLMGLLAGLLVSVAIINILVVFLATLSYDFPARIVRESRLARQFLALAPGLYRTLSGVLIF